MGYRSEVAIKCEGKAFEMFKKAFQDGVSCILPDKIFKDGDEYILYWDWVKWYEDYEDVRIILSVMDELDTLQNPNDDNTGYGYKFLRIGEDNDDVETRENSWDIELWMIRKINIPDDLEEVKVAY